MTEEYLDIVDENGNLTGKKDLRSIVHEKGLWHRTVHIYCYRFRNNKLELIVQLRAKNKQQYPNKWTVRFGGHVESGHTLEETVSKELFEETGLQATVENMVPGMINKYDGFISENNKQNNREFSFAYYYNYEEPIESLKFNDCEVQQAKWMTTEEIKEAILNEGNWVLPIEVFEKILDDIDSKICK